MSSTQLKRLLVFEASSVTWGRLQRSHRGLRQCGRCWHPSWYFLHRIVQRVALVRVLVRVGVSFHSLWSSGTGGFFFFLFLLAQWCCTSRTMGVGGRALWCVSVGSEEGESVWAEGSAISSGWISWTAAKLQDSSHIDASNRSGDKHTIRQSSKEAKAAAVNLRLTSAVGGDISVRPQHFSRYSLSPKTCREQISFNWCRTTFPTLLQRKED